MTFFLKKISLFERERVSMSWGEREKQTPSGAGNLTQGSITGPWDQDLRQWQMLNQLSPPGVPEIFNTAKKVSVIKLKTF